ncbi:unnamed protein product [Haemonchus placei]|uniref:GAE domain-containing protein n=1 Tax=Haemonchus placei TaxID=6290 RepID=A0A0N4WT37_HAEPC|nr:unnamed protein product [Haemonchus placei]
MTAREPQLMTVGGQQQQQSTGIYPGTLTIRQLTLDGNRAVAVVLSLLVPQPAVAVDTITATTVQSSYQSIPMTFRKWP